MAKLQAAEFKKRQAELAKLQPQWLKEEMEVGLGLGLGLGLGFGFGLGLGFVPLVAGQ